MLLSSTFIMLLAFLCTTLLVLINLSSVTLFWLASVLASLLAGATVSFYMAALNRFAAASPDPLHLSAVYTGQGVAGAVVSFASFLTIAAAPLAPDFCMKGGGASHNRTEGDTGGDCDAFRVDWSAFSYFAFVCITLALCMCGFLQLKQSRRGSKRRSGSAGNFSCDSLGLELEGEAAGDSSQALIEAQVGQLSPGEVGNDEPAMVRQRYSAIAVMRETKLTLGGVFLVFAVTLAVFPSFTAISTSEFKCQPNSSRAANDLFVPLLFLAFNVFDLLGRVVASAYPLENAKLLFWSSAARILMIPFFFMTRVNGEAQAWLSWDGFPFLLLIVLGATNGYLATCIMVVGPRTLPNGYGRDLSSTLHLFALTIGLLAGATLSLGLIKLV